MTALLEYVRVDDEAAVRFRQLPLRIVMLSGDFCPKWVPTELQKMLVHAQPRVFTLGGATEASIWSCYYEVHSVAQAWRSIPYGKPLANQVSCSPTTPTPFPPRPSRYSATPHRTRFGTGSLCP